MTRVLVWNLQNFGINKIDNPGTGYSAGHGGLPDNVASHERRALVVAMLQAINPDVIMLVEVSSGFAFGTDLTTATGGLQGCCSLLQLLRNDPVIGTVSWRLVPPLRVGAYGGSRPESVAVFYRGWTQEGNNTIYRYFTGPNWWTGGVYGRTVAPQGGGRAAYAGGGGYPDMNALLVPPNTAVRNVPQGALHNPGLAENTLAARTEFLEANPPVPNSYLDFGPFRQPYMATFTEEIPNVAQRDLTLFGIHSPAVSGDQSVFIDYLASAADVVSPLGNAETRLVGGDFNLPLLAPDGTDAGNYDSLTNGGYRLLLDPAGPPPVNPADLEAYKGYFATHIRNRSYTRASKLLWSTAVGNDSPYPGYGYTGSNRVQNFYSIDNLLVWTNNPPNAYDTTIMNPVVGSPFNAVVPAPGGAPTGVAAMGNGFANAPLGWPPAPAAPAWQLGRATSLVSWANYGRILSTSDHFALYTVL